MKSLLKSVGTICLLVVSLVLMSCRTGPKAEEDAPSAQVREELQDEISLKADRESLSELRAAIPEEKKQNNDELALLLGLMGEIKLKPSDIQGRYQNLAQKHRKKFRDRVSKLRDQYRREESKRREGFLREQKSLRDDFKHKKADREESKEFFAEQDRRRQEFFANEKDRRKDFESEIQTQSKDFDSYMNEKQKEFSEQLRLYSKRFHEAEKEKSKKTSQQSDPNQALKEFEAMKDKASTPLGAGADGN